MQILMIGICFFLVFFSGLFSGLIVSFMSFSKHHLMVLQNSEQEKERKRAEKLLLFYPKQSWLMSTLLLGNIAVNSALTILFTKIFGDLLLAFLISIVVLFILGEIVPIILFSRYSLAISANMIWFANIFIRLLGCISWPVSKFINYSRKDGDEYNMTELRESLLILQKKTQDGENQNRVIGLDLIKNSFSFGEKKVEEFITPLNKVFMLNEAEKMDIKMMNSIWKTGFSRIPVYKKDKNNVVGILFAKDMMLINPEDKHPISYFLSLYKRGAPLRVDSDSLLHEVLQEFRLGKCHMGIVQRVNNESTTRDPFYENIGIITLEDIIEEIIGEEIVDETDVWIDVANQTKRQTSQNDYFDHVNINSNISRRDLPSELTPQEERFCFHLIADFPVFQQLSHIAIKKLIKKASIIQVMENAKEKQVSTRKKINEYLDIAEGGMYLYQKGKPSEFFSLVLDGKIKIRAGRDNFVSEIDKWEPLCTHILKVDDEKCKTEQTWSYIPDFSAKATSNSRILRISRSQFLECLLSDSKEIKSVTKDSKKTISTVKQIKDSAIKNEMSNHNGSDLKKK